MGGRRLGLLPRWWMRLGLRGRMMVPAVCPALGKRISCCGLATIRSAVRMSDVVSLTVWCLSFRKQRAASCPSARPGCASGKGIRGEPERNEIDGFGHFVFVLGGSPLEYAEGLAPKPCEAGSGRVCGLMCACVRNRHPRGPRRLTARGGRFFSARVESGPPRGARPNRCRGPGNSIATD
jgi:hypothetical protein